MNNEDLFLLPKQNYLHPGSVIFLPMEISFSLFWNIFNLLKLPQLVQEYFITIAYLHQYLKIVFKTADIFVTFGHISEYLLYFFLM